MATEPPSSGPPPRAQRAWRAACPGCGAPVEFASSASASAVCSFCRSTVLRDGATLRRIGVSAELFDDHSPLQLGVRGKHQGVPFSIVGRLQYAYADGTWNEWHVLFDGAGADGAPRAAWLSEDNGAYVLSFDLPTPADVPPLAELHAGERRLIGANAWSVASVVRAKLLAAEGELPRPPLMGTEFTVVDLRSTTGEVATLDDANPTQPAWSVGQSVALSSLALSGLRETSEKTLQGRTVPCPSCGASLSPKLESTQSMSCPQCRAVVDLNSTADAVGVDLRYYAQNNSGPGGLEPQIPIGRTGRLALGDDGPLDWQVVGYMERCDLPLPGTDDEDDEQTFWREYLLFNRTAGFAFLVDAEDGWSWVRPMTGVPQVNGRGATWKGAAFRQRYRYAAKVTWVQGEFYWRVRRDERADVTDYDGPSGGKMSREQTGSEVVWSLGRTIPSTDVAKAFNIPAALHGAFSRDSSPLSGLSSNLGTSIGSGGSSGLSQGVIILIVVLVVVVLMARCSNDDCDETRATFGESSAEYQQCLRNQRSSGGYHGGGGSFGGYSSGGGGHK
ncbi:DUF4178 domain-containing protein [Ideonella sp. DXS29W]|uniref:DUF4178 domain-containing protein n=1 Tax=Ideonella lacteola TaxID=2984193 RepID=A0ABU9BK61_9BURK